MIYTYDDFIKYLYTLEDIKYRDFNKKIILKDNIIGIRTDKLKYIARLISKNDYNKFIALNKHKLYEENLLHGLLLGYIKLDFNKFLPFIDNWAICDLTVSNLKIFKNNKELGLKEIKKYLKNSNTWINRFGYVLLLNYYVEDKYIDFIFKSINNYKDEYYVKMAISWLISICYIKYKDKTLEFLKNNKLDKFTYNKSRQKIIESSRVSIDEKNMLRTMKK